MFALIDGNNFYVSCERAFNPRLQFFSGDWPQLILRNSALGISDPAVQKKLQAWLQQGSNNQTQQ